MLELPAIDVIRFTALGEGAEGGVEKQAYKLQAFDASHRQFLLRQSTIM